MYISKTLAHVGNVLSFIAKDGPGVFELEDVVHKRFEVLATTEEEV